MNFYASCYQAIFTYFIRNFNGGKSIHHTFILQLTQAFWNSDNQISNVISMIHHLSILQRSIVHPKHGFGFKKFCFVIEVPLSQQSPYNNLSFSFSSFLIIRILTFMLWINSMLEITICFPSLVLITTFPTPVSWNCSNCPIQNLKPHLEPYLPSYLIFFVYSCYHITLTIKMKKQLRVTDLIIFL